MAVSNVFVQVPVRPVGSGLQHDVKYRATTAPILSRECIGDGLELSDGVWGRIDDNAFRRARQIEVAIQVPGIGSALTAIHRNVRALQVCRVGEGPELAIEPETAAGRTISDHPGDKENQLLQVASLQRQILNGSRVNGRGKIGCAGLHQRHLGRHLDRLRGRTNAQLGVCANHATRGHLDIRQGKLGEPLGVEQNAVLPRHQIHYAVITCVVCLRRQRDGGVQRHNSYVHIWNDGVLRVRDHTFNHAAIQLAREGNCETEGDRQYKEQPLKRPYHKYLPNLEPARAFRCQISFLRTTKRPFL